MARDTPEDGRRDRGESRSSSISSGTRRFAFWHWRRRPQEHRHRHPLGSPARLGYIRHRRPPSHRRRQSSHRRRRHRHRRHSHRQRRPRRIRHRRPLRISHRRPLRFRHRWPLQSSHRRTRPATLFSTMPTPSATCRFTRRTTSEPLAYDIHRGDEFIRHEKNRTTIHNVTYISSSSSSSFYIPPPSHHRQHACTRVVGRIPIHIPYPFLYGWWVGWGWAWDQIQNAKAEETIRVAGWWRGLRLYTPPPHLGPR